MITAYEVVRFSPAGKDYPTVNICEAIPQVEEAFGYSCLGADLYEYLLSVLVPYPETAAEYDPGTDYALGEYVVRHGCLFVSAVDCNRTDPLDADTDWTPVDRFTDACANTLWTKYLRRILALRVYEAVVLYDTQTSGAAGVTIRIGDGYSSGSRAASKGEIGDRQKRLQNDASTTLENMYRWMQKQIDDATCTTLPLESGTACWSANCQKPSRGGRRIAWRY